MDHHARLLSDICNALEWVATGLAIAALIFSGVGILVVLGIAATALALAGRTLLAATGDGSWLMSPSMRSRCCPSDQASGSGT